MAYISNRHINMAGWIFDLGKWACLLTILVFHQQARAIPVTMEESPARSVADASSVVTLSGRDGAQAFTGINDLLNAGEYGKVIARAKRMLTEHPNSALAFEVLGAAQLLAGQRNEALESLSRAKELDPNEPGILTKLGTLRMEMGDLAQAESLLLSALRLNPKHRLAHQRLGLLYEYQQDIPRAIEHLRKGLVGTSNRYLGVSVNLGRLLNKVRRYNDTVAVLEPRLPMDAAAPPEAHLILATAYLRTDQFELAKQRFERFVELQPDSLEGKLGIGIALRGLGKNEAAASIFKELVAERPEWVVSYLELGETYLRMERLDPALDTFEDAEKLGADKRRINKRVAEYHIERRNLKAAGNIYQALLDSDGAQPPDYADYAEVLLASGQPQQGEEVLREGVRRFDDSAYLHLRLGSYLASLQRYRDALPSMRRAVELAPNDPTALRALSLLQSRLGDTEAAAQTAEKLYSAASSPPEAMVFYATQLQANNQSLEAKSMYREALAADPDNVLALNNLANLLAEKNQLKEAEELARRAVSQAKNNGHVMDTLGWILYRQGRLEEASEILHKATQRAPSSATIHYHAGVAFAKIGMPEKAHAALTKALELDADASWATDARKLLKN